MKRLFLILPILLFFYSCADNGAQAEDKSDKKSRFQKYTDCVPRSLKKSSALAKEGGYTGALTLDVVIRDFQSNHPDFENFSEVAAEHLDDVYNYKTSTGTAMNLNGYDVTWYSNAPYHYTCGNALLGSGVQIGADGLPMMVNSALPAYLQTVSSEKALEYGDCTRHNLGSFQQGYKNATDDVSGYKCVAGNMTWSNPVIYTPGMVSPHLAFAPGASSEIDMLNDVKILKATEACDNQFFEQWYADVPGVNKRINTTMDIPKDPNSSYFIFEQNYNNGGFFPLDSIDPVTRSWISAKYPDQFDPQSLSIYCPPFDYQYAHTQQDAWGQNTYKLCQSWLNYGGPRAVNSAGSGLSAAALAAAENGKLGLQHLRNYGFTMMGYAKFKYKLSNQVPLPETFEFVGDDDMWIFVDGVLVVDLGGTHAPAPGKVDIKVLAYNNHGCHAGEPLATYSNCAGASDVTGWADDTWHHLHIFYANRQSDGSNVYIRSSLAEVAPTRFGYPTINNVVTKVDKNGSAVNSMYLNTPLSDASVANIMSLGSPSLLVMRETNVNGKMQTVVNGFYITSIKDPIDKGADGFMYQFTGVLKDAVGNVVDGGLLADDRIAFNVPYSKGLDDDGNGGNFSNDVWSQIMSWSKLMTFVVTSSSGQQVERFEEMEWWAENLYSSERVDDPKKPEENPEIEYCED